MKMVSKKFYEWWKKSPKKRKQRVSGTFQIAKFIGMSDKQAEQFTKKYIKVKRK